MNIPIQDGKLNFEPHFYIESEAASLFTALRTELNWKEETIIIFGKEVLQPRLLAWYADAGKAYTYSGKTNEPNGWSPTLLKIKRQIEEATKQQFNSCLCNLYRHGTDSMGWHSDDEDELGRNPVIASLSLGAMRPFKLQHKTDKEQKLTVALNNGSLLVMSGRLQHCWKHSIPKTTKAVGERINLTFRYIY